MRERERESLANVALFSQELVLWDLSSERYGISQRDAKKRIWLHIHIYSFGSVVRNLRRECSDRSTDNLDDAPTEERCASAGSLPFSNAVVARRCGSAGQATVLAIGRLLVAPLLFVALLRFVSYSLRLRCPLSHALRTHCCSVGTLLEALRTHCRSVGTLTLEALRSCFDFIPAVGAAAAATDVCSHGSSL
jgi:hypothetical protein